MAAATQPNWLAIAGYVYALYGFAFLAAAVGLGRPVVEAATSRQRQIADGRQRVTILVGVALFATAALLLALAEFHILAFDGRVVALLLGLIVVMVVQTTLLGIAERPAMADAAATATAATTAGELPALPPPSSEPPRLAAE